jgi:protein-S-isoprenylcysteine O-methyltransferase Ste14
MLAGFGIVLANWASLAALVVIPVLGHLPRIAVEDALLIDRLGEPYPRVRRDHGPARAGRLVVDSKAAWVPAQ